jgi:hypothetical protein
MQMEMQRAKGAMLLALMLFGPVAVGANPRTDPETNVIRLIHIGKAWYNYGTPAPVFAQDPKISWHPVPAHAWSMGADAFRMLRLYLPRSKERFHNELDVVAIAGMDALDLRLDFQGWLKEGLEEEGMGFVMADDSSSFATSGSHTLWYTVPLGELLPVNDKPVGGSPYGKREAFHIVPVDPDHEFTRNIPWEEVWVEANNRPWPRLGSTVVTKMSEEHNVNKDKVQMVYWSLGTAGGRSVAWIHAWCASPDFWRWRYSFDVIAHVIYFAARVPIPQDLVLVHSIREMIEKQHYARVFALATMEFADKFRANIGPVEAMLEDVGEQKAEADRLYLEQEYEDAAAAMHQVLVGLEDVNEQAIRAKDRAMAWVFFVEWLIVSATSMLSGALAWTLMVRRRLYREVGETRLLARAKASE